MGNRAIELIARPAVYLAWAVGVVGALSASYFSDPYIFALTTLGLAWLTALVGVVGVSAAVVAKTARSHARILIIVSVGIAVAAVAVALGLLRTFKWA